MRYALRLSILFPTLVTLASGPAARSADPEPPARPAARRAIEPVTPELPAAIVAAMQEGRYAEADRAL